MIVFLHNNTAINSSEFVDVYVFPRYTVLSKHAAKGFIPYTNLLDLPPPPPPTSRSPDISGSPSRPLTPPHSPRLSFAALSHSQSPSSASSSSSASDEPSHAFIQGSITCLTPHSVSFVRPDTGRNTRRGSLESTSSIGTTVTYGYFDGPEETIEFDYCIYALGSGMPDPVNVWSEYPLTPRCIPQHPTEHGLGTKRDGIAWMERKAAELKKAKNVLIVGGGALGIREWNFGNSALTGQDADPCDTQNTPPTSKICIPRNRSLCYTHGHT